MESAREVPLFSQLSTVSIKNYNDKIVVNLLPHLEKIVEMASAYVPSNTSSSNAVGVASEINESSSVIHLSYSNARLHNSGRTLTVKEPPLEIIIEQPLDERSLVNLSRLVGEHTPASMSQEEAASLFALLEKNQVDHLKIKSTGIRLVFRILEQTFRPLYRLPPQFEHFTGRNQELSALRERRNTVQVIAPREDLPEEEKHDKSISQIAGTGGIGKSQLANYYARLQFREKNYDWIIWMVGGEDDQRAHNNLSSQFADLGLALGLDVKQLQDEVLHQLIYERLAAKGRGLVVVDDAPNYAVVKPFLPESFGHSEMDVLITTRNSQTFDSVLTKILLDVFTLGDAKHYIRRLLNDTCTEADAEVLATTLDRYPLALTQALAYILNNQCTIAEYCQRYKTLRAAQKKYLDTPVYEDDPYQLEHQQRKRKFAATMKAVVELSLEQVKTICKTEDAFERAKRILLATTYLAPESAIPKGLLGRWLPDDENENQINDVLESLRALSLLEEDSQIATYRIHQVVQDTLRLDEITTTTQSRLLQWHTILDEYLRSSSISYIEFEEKHKVLKAHLIVLSQHINRQPRTDAFLEAEIFMYRGAGLADSFQGKEKAAKSCFEHALGFCNLMSTRNTAILGDSLMNLGVAAKSCGDPRSAKAYLEKALLILQDDMGEGYLQVGRCLMNLGMATLSSGDPQRAKEYMERALLILLATLGNENISVGLCRINLGLIIFDCGDPQSAKKYFEESLPTLKAQLGDRHAHVGRCTMDLGWASMSCGDPKKAKSYFETALPILKDTLGDRHANIGLCLSGLGSATLSCGDPQTAKSYLETALPILEANLGKKNADVGRCWMNLGWANLCCGDPQSAKQYLEEALQILQVTLGKGHADVGRCWMNLGLAEKGCNEKLRSKQCLEIALPILEATQGKKHADLGRCWNNLGWASLSCGDAQAGKEQMQVALPILQAALGDKHTEIALCKMNLGSADLSCGDPQSAKKYLEEALSIFKTNMGDRHADVGRCLANLGSVTLKCGDRQRAKKYWEEALPILQDSLGNEHMDVGLCNMQLGCLCLLCDDLLGAIKYLLEALPILISTLGNEHASVGRCYMKLGQANLYLCNTQFAREYLEIALRIFTRLLGEQHNTVITCQELLSQAIKVEVGLSIFGSTSSELKKEPDSSRETIIDLISEDMMPLPTTLAFEVAQYLYNLEQIEPAIKVLSLLIETNPVQPQALMLKAQCHIAIYEFDAAEDCIATALSLDNDLDAKLVFEELNKARENYLNLLGKVQNTLAVETLEAREKIIHAKNLCAIGKHSQALVFLNQLAQQSLDANLLGAIFYQSARCYFLNQNWNEALNCIDKSLEIKHHPDAEALRLKIIEAANSAEKIERLLSILVIEEPENSQQFRPN